MYMKPWAKYRTKLGPASNNIGCERWESDNTLSNVGTGNKPPLQGCVRFENMLLKPKRKVLVAFVMLELLEEENESIKRGQTREEWRERVEKSTFHTILQLLLQQKRYNPDQMAQISNTIASDMIKQRRKKGRWTDKVCWKDSFNAQIILATGESFRWFYFQFRISRTLCVKQQPWGPLRRPFYSIDVFSTDSASRIWLAAERIHIGVASTCWNPSCCT